MSSAHDVNSAVDACSIQRTLEVIGDRWILLILRDVFRGVRRFSRIHSDLGIAKNLLSDRLNALVDADIVTRVPYQHRPLRHEYQLTDKGRDLSAALVALMHWGDTWCHHGDAPTVLLHADCGTEVQLHPWCTTCDRAVPATAIRSQPGPRVDSGYGLCDQSLNEPATRKTAPLPTTPTQSPRKRNAPHHGSTQPGGRYAPSP